MKSVQAGVDRCLLRAYRALESSGEGSLHDFRVELRRLRALARWLFREEPLLDSKCRRELGRWLQRARLLQRSTSDLRDAEVLASTHAARERARKRVAQWKHEKAFLAARELRLGGEILDAALDGLARAQPKGESSRRVARLKTREKRLKESLQRLLQVTAPSAGALHQVRIHLKRIRYAKEFWLGRPDRRLAEWQELLGALQDAELAREQSLKTLRRKVRVKNPSSHRG